MTDISPSDAGAHTQGDLAQALFGDPVHWGTNEIGYLEIQFDQNTVQRVSDVYNPVFLGKGIFLASLFASIPACGFDYRFWTSTICESAVARRF